MGFNSAFKGLKKQRYFQKPSSIG